MTVNGKRPEPCIVYADIIELPHWQSPTRPHMSLHDRAAQFASYKALSGYEDMVAEEARLTDREIEPGEYDRELLNQKLTLIAEVLETGVQPVVTFTVFVPDARKAGGAYVKITDAVKKLDTTDRKVVLASREEHGRSRTIDINRIAGISGGPADALDNTVV